MTERRADRGALPWGGLVAVLAVACGHGPPLVAPPGRPPAALVIRNVHVFDAPQAALLEGLHDVLVRDGRIADVAAADGALAAPAVIDGKGGTLLPGLIDVHVHTSGAAAPLWQRVFPDAEDTLRTFLYAGVTTVLDAGGLTPAVFRLRESVREGRVLGPHLYAAGPMFTTPGGHPVGFFRRVLPWWLSWYVIPRFTREVATPAAASEAVAALLPEHPDVLKIAVDEIPGFEPRLPTDVLTALVAAAHAGHVRAVAHIGHSVDALDAVHAGIDALLHDVYAEDISSEAVAAVAAAHVPVAATIAIWDAVETSTSARTTFLPLEREVGSPDVLAALASVPASFDPRPFEPFAQTMRSAHLARRNNVARLRAAGVTILAGSDSPASGLFAGVALHLELGKLVEAGMTPGEALRAATVDNARFLAGPEADFGEIAPGKRADLLLVDGDPVSTIGDTMRIVAVVLDGVPLDRRPRPPGS